MGKFIASKLNFSQFVTPIRVCQSTNILKKQIIFTSGACLSVFENFMRQPLSTESPSGKLCHLIYYRSSVIEKTGLQEIYYQYLSVQVRDPADEYFPCNFQRQFLFRFCPLNLRCSLDLWEHIDVRTCY